MVVSRKGVAAVLLSNVLFGVLYLYSHFMQPMVGSDVFAWRMAHGGNVGGTECDDEHERWLGCTG